MQPASSMAADGGTREVKDRPVVLVVDDDEDSRELYAYLLSRDGFRVREAENGAQALEAARADGILAIVMDGDMPVMGGHEAAQRLKDDPATRGIPILMLSGTRRRAGDPDRCDAYLEKPCSGRTLVKMVRTLVRAPV
jgi:CheY-like chemotaxis protein